MRSCRSYDRRPLPLVYVLINWTFGVSFALRIFTDNSLGQLRAGVVGMGLGTMRRGFDGVAGGLGFLGNPPFYVARGFGMAMGAEWFWGPSGI